MRATIGIVPVAALLLGSCGVELPPESPPQGTLVITEIAAEPHDDRPEWFELFNASDQRVALSNCFVETEDDDNDLFLDLALEPGDRIVLSDMSDLGAEPGELRADAVIQDLLLRHSTADDFIEVWCAENQSQSALVASATWNWSEEARRKGRSRQLVEGSDPPVWCEAPTRDDAIYYDVEIPSGDPGETIRVVEYGTPGAPAICDAPAGETPSLRGQVLFSELMIDAPDGDSMPEWFEFVASPANDATLDLRGCLVTEAPHLGGDGTVRSHLLDPELGATGIAPGERLLLADASVVSARTDHALVIDGSVPVDYFYASVTFSNSTLRSLTLTCPGPDGPVDIDTVSFDWARYDGDFDSFSLELSDGVIASSALDASVNDRPSAWCTADATDVFASGSYSWVEDKVTHEGEFEYRGTPGESNGSCPVSDPWPGEGDVIFTEIMGNPAGTDTSEEWFEVWNTTGKRYGLEGCRFEDNNLDSGVEHDWPVEFLLPIDGDAYLIMATSPNGDFWSCIDEPDADYRDVSFNNGDSEELLLICPDGIGGELVVDRVVYDSNFGDGISLQVPAALASAANNDDTADWCSLPAGDPGYTFSCLDTESGETNYGTPGEASNCP